MVFSSATPGGHHSRHHDVAPHAGVAVADVAVGKDVDAAAAAIRFLASLARVGVGNARRIRTVAVPVLRGCLGDDAAARHARTQLASAATELWTACEESGDVPDRSRRGTRTGGHEPARVRRVPGVHRRATAHDGEASHALAGGRRRAGRLLRPSRAREG